MLNEIFVSDRMVKRSQVKVLSVAEGFFQSSVLFALLKLRIFEAIDNGSKTVYELASLLNARPETLSRLLNAGVILRILESGDGIRFNIGPEYRAVLSPSATENYIGNWVASLDYFSMPLAKLDEVILKSRPAVDSSNHVFKDQRSVREFTLGMHNYAAQRGKELANFLNIEKVNSLLDLGCGPGTYAFQLGVCNPNLDIHLLDVPEVLEIAKEVERKYYLKNKIHYLPMDALKCDIPGSYDMILVSNVLHGLGESASREMIKRSYRSLNDGGSLVIQAQYLRDDRLGGRWAIFLDLMMLCTTLDGRNHSQVETRAWLEETGFKSIEFCPMSLLNTNSFLRGYKR